MDSFSIGISGLEAAQRAFDIIGNNVANAATDGYHRQRIELRPSYSSQAGALLLGGGVDVVGVTRLIDGLLEQEILRQESLLGQVSQEFATLQTVENAFGEFFEGSGLSAAIDNFFNALQDLSAHPTEIIWQNQLVSAAKTMAGQFRTLGEFLTELKRQIELEAENTIEQVNILTNRIAELNDSIEKHEISGGQDNNMRDLRDQYIKELSSLVSIETKTRQYGVIDVYIAGTPVVVGASAMDLETGLKEDGKLGISVAGVNTFNINVQGGQLGGLLSLRNKLVSDIRDDLDDLATAMIQQINQYHVQGVGSTGSFTGLTGWWVSSENLADFGSDVTDGKIYIRVTNTSTGAITRTEIPVDKSADSLSDIATRISAITGLSASVISSKLHIQADTNYKFDFLPAVLPEPESADIDFNGSSDPTVSVSGIYTGRSNDTFGGFNSQVQLSQILFCYPVNFFRS
ncbi:MAG: flagellar hook-associated protein FlgK [Planctomycetota bacterium]